MPRVETWLAKPMHWLKPKSVRLMKVADAIAALTVDADLDAAAVAAGMCPESADFGQLNSIGHELADDARKVRGLLTARSGGERAA